MDSEIQQQQYQHHFQGFQKQTHHQKQQPNSLKRFRSAPSSNFASFLDAADTVPNNSGAGVAGGGGDRSGFSNAKPLSPETENIITRFISSMGDRQNSAVQPESMVRVKVESDTTHHQQQQNRNSSQQQSNYSTVPQRIYQSASKPPLANYQSSGMGSAPSSRMKIGIGGSNCFGLARNSSSPAGFFADINIDGYGVVKGMENYGGNNNGINQMNYSSGQSSSTSGLIKQSSDVQGTLMRMNSLEETKFNNNRNSWADSIMSENFNTLDGGGHNNDFKREFSEHNISENQPGESRSRPPPLAHHLSLPNTSAELSAMEKLLNLQDAVPLRIRAKRGCATHPRSIAERVRKNKISERMRKLQDLVPNMDKQTNTADMLDLAVDYIRDLQTQVKNLHGNRAKCTCPR
ncbi:hypothetical protein RND81_04G244100 [Saponaria officinalis]|uniref:BHLH domain-containing protein n=1 Tax=Saponaria officinalis TaxID=3572 RepID=A0AAW1LMZ8_SAPOF